MLTVVIIDTDLDVGALWAAVEETVPRTAVAVAGAVATVEAQVPEDDGSAEADVLAGLSLSEAAAEHLDQLVRGLDAAWRQMADRLQEAGDDAKVEVVVPEGGGRAKLSVDKLGAVGEPESLTWLKNTTEAMLPRIELPDLLFEVHSWTGFLDAFGHVSERRTRMEGLLVSPVALLVSQSCNIGLTPVIDTENKALSRSRLSHVDQNYVRADTIAAANAALITAQSRIELAQMWGGGLLASVDGLRFVVPVKSINTGPSPKYYGYKRGVTWLNAVHDQVAGIGAMVVRGTPRDSLYTLDTLLNLDGGVKPEMVATDNASYSDMAFGLYKMLGFRFTSWAATCSTSRPAAPARACDPSATPRPRTTRKRTDRRRTQDVGPFVAPRVGRAAPPGDPAQEKKADRRKPGARRPTVAQPTSREQGAQRASRPRIAAAISSGASSAMKCPARVSRWSRSGAHAFHTPAAS